MKIVINFFILFVLAAGVSSTVYHKASKVLFAIAQTPDQNVKRESQLQTNFKGR